VHVADLEAGRSRGETTRAERGQAALVRQAAIGLVWSMNWLSCEVPKNSFSAATTGRMLIRSAA
jgi:hypothetical protein